MFKKSKISLMIFSLVLLAIPLFATRADEGTSTDNFYIFRRGNGAGDVTVKRGEQILLSCGDNCVSRINEGENLILSAKARSGSTFKGWSVNKDNSYIDPIITTEDFNYIIPASTQLLNFSTSTNASVISSSTNNINLIYAKFVLNAIPEVPVVSIEDRDIPRVMFWFGKVNQHWDLEKGVWATDPDGSSGARENKLEYCKKFYPTTEKVVTYKEETTNTWKDAGNINNYTSSKVSYRCVLKGENSSNDDVSNLAEKPNKGSVCYWFPNDPLCLPLSDSKAIRSALSGKLDNFVNQGVDPNTTKLGQGERTAALKSYKQVFKKLPDTEEAFADVVKISNGQWPSQTSKEAEKVASTEFEKIYKKVPDLSNKNDAAAVTVIAYGLRQKAENRNLASEAAALKTFKAVYKRTPNSTSDWNALQAVAYSGATR